MFTSATERTAFLYLLATIGVAAFGGVYELFSHGVWSGFMVYAFAFPLVLGTLPFAWLALHKHPLPRPWVYRLHHAGVATLTLGSVMEGVFAISAMERTFGVISSSELIVLCRTFFQRGKVNTITSEIAT